MRINQKVQVPPGPAPFVIVLNVRTRMTLTNVSGHGSFELIKEIEWRKEL